MRKRRGMRRSAAVQHSADVEVRRRLLVQTWGHTGCLTRPRHMGLPPQAACHGHNPPTHPPPPPPSHLCIREGVPCLQPAQQNLQQAQSLRDHEEWTVRGWEGGEGRGSEGGGLKARQTARRQPSHPMLSSWSPSARGTNLSQHLDPVNSTLVSGLPGTSFGDLIPQHSHTLVLS